MPDRNQKRLQRTTFIYWTLLLYIVAALVWWWISLEKQNQLITTEQYRLLEAKADTLSSLELSNQAARINNLAIRNSTKHLSEGITFLIVILIGAVFVYRAVRRQLLLQQQQQHFMMAVTHELKTPIAVTRLNLETLQKYQLEPEKQQKLIRISLDETARLNFLTNNILVSSQLDSKGFEAEKEELNLSALLKDCLHDLKKRFPDRTVDSHVQEDIDIKGDPLLLQILINNLLENAVKYSPTESPLSVSLKQNSGDILLDVADQGPGIPDKEKKKIFERFYRIGNESTRTTKGTGLGLYLCQRIAKDHHASIEVKDNHPKGTLFTIIFAA